MLTLSLFSGLAGAAIYPLKQGRGFWETIQTAGIKIRDKDPTVVAPPAKILDHIILAGFFASTVMRMIPQRQFITNEVGSFIMLTADLLTSKQ